MSVLAFKTRILSLLLGCLLCAGAGAHAEGTSTAAAIEDGIVEATNALHEADFKGAISRLENLAAAGRWEVPFWLGTAYLLDGQLDNAELMLDDALSLQSDVVEIWVQRAVVAQERQQPQVALQFLEVAAQVDGGFPLTFLNVGIAYESLGEMQNARGAYGRFLKLSAAGSETSRVRRLRRDVLTTNRSVRSLNSRSISIGSRRLRRLMGLSGSLPSRQDWFLIATHRLGPGESWMIEIDTGTDELLCSIEDRVATVTLNKPDKRNALGDVLTPALREVLLVLEADSRVGCVMITGAGKAFCSGGDVSGMGGGSKAAPKSADERVAELTRKQESLTLRLYELAKPTIAALPGAAAGAGLSIALACDLRLAARDAFVITAFRNIGLSGDYGASWFLNRLIGQSKAKELMFRSERVGAEECERLGLVNRVFEP